MYEQEKDDSKWIKINYGKLQRRYADMYIAVFKKRVIAASEDFDQMYSNAKKDALHFVTSYVAGEVRVL